MQCMVVNCLDSEYYLVGTYMILIYFVKIPDLKETSGYGLMRIYTLLSIEVTPFDHNAGF